jgi:hypothetical protein
MRQLHPDWFLPCSESQDAVVCGCGRLPLASPRRWFAGNHGALRSVYPVVRKGLFVFRVQSCAVLFEEADDSEFVVSI